MKKFQNVPSDITYEPVAKPDQAAVFAVFNFLFKKTLEKNNPRRTENIPTAAPSLQEKGNP